MQLAWLNFIQPPELFASIACVGSYNYSMYVPRTLLSSCYPLLTVHLGMLPVYKTFHPAIQFIGEDGLILCQSLMLGLIRN